MGPDLQSSGTPLRCPACSASVRPGAPWCTQCYADLRPPAAASSPAAPAAPSAAPSLPPAAPATSPAAPVPAQRLLPGDEPVWPCASCSTPNPITLDTCATCGAGFLAALRTTEEPLLVLPVVGDLGALSRGQRLGLAAGVVVLVVLLTALLGFLLS